jgi:predicted TIM-barrel fold metal-dependent hydrolase
MGGWRQWDAVLDELAGRDLYLDTSYTLPYIGPERFVELVRAHGPSHVLFGSDGPWADVTAEVAAMEGLREHGLRQAELEAIMAGNARRLLGL